RLFLLVPPNAEFEEGFPLWLSKLAKLSLELSVPIKLNCTERTHTAIVKFVEGHKFTLTINFHQLKEWDDFLLLSRQITKTDLLVMVSARKGYISHFGQLDKIPTKLEKYFAELSKMVIYPQ